MARGIDINTPWEWCIRTNGTYLDCPIANFNDNRTFITAVHNPALKIQTISTIKVPHDHYKA